MVPKAASTSAICHTRTYFKFIFQQIMIRGLMTLSLTAILGGGRIYQVCHYPREAGRTKKDAFLLVFFILQIHS
jgi:hypothetical protein